MPTRSGGKILIDHLVLNQVKRVFTVPGESFLDVLDALSDEPIETIVCRHEGGASFMAESHGKMTGRPGVAFVTRGPGATNASCGVHVAMHDSTPMILFVGQVKRIHRNRDSFQEIDMVDFFSPICKWAVEIEDAKRIPEYLDRAFYTAMSGRPGPVVLSLPEDMLIDQCYVNDRIRADVSILPPDQNSVEDAYLLIQNSARPIAILGGSHWSQRTSSMAMQVSQGLNLPMVTSFRRQDYIDNRFENYIGDLSSAANHALRKLFSECDCLLLLGTRFGDITSNGYRLLSFEEAQSSIIHIHSDPAEPGRVWPCRQKVCTTPHSFMRNLLRMMFFERPDENGWVESCRQVYRNWIQPVDLPGKVKMALIIQWLSNNLPDDAIITNGAGNYATFLHRYFQFKQYGTQFAATSGSMGYGLPAAISAKLEYPERTVVCISGDGCFQMTLNELSTACQFGVNIITIIACNQIYGTIRMHQELNYPYRPSATDLFNPDYSKLANAYGIHGETVHNTSDFPKAFERAAQSGKSAIIELHLDPEAISTSKTITEIQTQH